MADLQAPVAVSSPEVLMVFETGSSYQSIKFNRPRSILVVEDLQPPVAESSPEVLMVLEIGSSPPIT